jgi:hypothetical protein
LLRLHRRIRSRGCPRPLSRAPGRRNGLPRTHDTRLLPAQARNFTPLHERDSRERRNDNQGREHTCA